MPAVATAERDELAAATPMTRLAVDTMPSFAPSTAARSQPARWLLWCSATCADTDEVISIRSLAAPSGARLRPHGIGPYRRLPVT
jgi:hypothetical protein